MDTLLIVEIVQTLPLEIPHPLPPYEYLLLINSTDWHNSTTPQGTGMSHSGAVQIGTTVPPHKALGYHTVVQFR